MTSVYAIIGPVWGFALLRPSTLAVSVRVDQLVCEAVLGPTDPYLTAERIVDYLRRRSIRVSSPRWYPSSGFLRDFEL